jgi:hypothetical protein
MASMKKCVSPELPPCATMAAWCACLEELQEGVVSTSGQNEGSERENGGAIRTFKAAVLRSAIGQRAEAAVSRRSLALRRTASDQPCTAVRHDPGGEGGGGGGKEGCR